MERRSTVTASRSVSAVTMTATTAKTETLATITPT